MLSHDLLQFTIIFTTYIILARKRSCFKIVLVPQLRLYIGIGSYQAQSITNKFQFNIDPPTDCNATYWTLSCILIEDDLIV